jgi:hypothetical protein
MSTNLEIQLYANPVGDSHANTIVEKIDRYFISQLPMPSNAELQDKYDPYA